MIEASKNVTSPIRGTLAFPLAYAIILPPPILYPLDTPELEIVAYPEALIIVPSTPAANLKNWSDPNATSALTVTLPDNEL